MSQNPEPPYSSPYIEQPIVDSQSEASTLLKFVLGSEQEKLKQLREAEARLQAAVGTAWVNSEGCRISRVENHTSSGPSIQHTFTSFGYCKDSDVSSGFPLQA